MELVLSYFKNNPYYTLIITFIIMLVQNTFTIIPLILVITINITLFGFFYGFLWSWFTSILAAVIIFLAVRYFFQEWVLKKMDSKLLPKIEKNGLMFVFQGRIFPFVPTSIINIVAGVSTITFKSFFIATMIGNFIYFFVLSLIPIGLFHMDEYTLGITFILSVCFIYLFKKMNNRRKQKLMEMALMKDQKENTLEEHH